MYHGRNRKSQLFETVTTIVCVLCIAAFGMWVAFGTEDAHATTEDSTAKTEQAGQAQHEDGEGYVSIVRWMIEDTVYQKTCSPEEAQSLAEALAEDETVLLWTVELHEIVDGMITGIGDAA